MGDDRYEFVVLVFLGVVAVVSSLAALVLAIAGQTISPVIASAMGGSIGVLAAEYAARRSK